MSKLQEKLNFLKPYKLNCNIFNVYDYDELTIQELLSEFFTKINECITVSNKTVDLANWLVNEGLEKEVVEQLLTWYQDGTLSNIINETIFNELSSKIKDVENGIKSSFLLKNNISIEDLRDENTNTSYIKVTIPKIYNNKWEVSIPKGWTNDNLILKSPRQQCIDGGYSLCINAGLVRNTTNNKPIGVTIKNGEIITTEITNLNWYLGITQEGNFECGKLNSTSVPILANKYKHVITSFVPLIINGEFQEESILQDCPNYNDKHPRQIICQNLDGDIVIITSNGRRQNQDGWTLFETQNVLNGMGLKFAFSLDGGGSAQTVYRNMLLNPPIDQYHTAERDVFSCLALKIDDMKNEKDEDIKDLSEMIGIIKKEVDYSKHYNVFDRGFIKLYSSDDNTTRQGIEVYQNNERINKLQLSPDALYYFDTKESDTIFKVNNNGEITTKDRIGYIQDKIVRNRGIVDELNITGLYYYSADELGILNQANYYVLQHIQINNTACLQIAIPYSDKIEHKTKKRKKSTEGEWSEWVDNQ